MKYKNIFITGSSSGIGLATALKFNIEGYRLILCARKIEKLTPLIKKIKVPYHILIFDVSKKDEVFKSVKSLPKEFSKIDILINNAGNAHGLEKSNECEIDDWDNMVDSNLKGLLYVTKSILESMVSNKAGHIINVGSIAAKEAYPKGNVYCATKAAVDKFTEGLRIDLNEYNIKVGAIHPGLVNTNFSTVRFKGDKKRADLVYSGLTPLLGKDIADIIFFMVECPYHVNISDITVLPTAQANTYILNKQKD